MKPIGGELSIKQLYENIYFTDSGRSSLKLLIRSGNKNKKFLIPDFLCGVIVDILEEEQINYEYYHINENLEIDTLTVNNKEFDIFYIINYFGQLNEIKNLNIHEKIVIEDNVFFLNFKNNYKFKKWFAFNSFRKISLVADGSMVKTNIKIDNFLINRKEADFVELKYEAKIEKYKFLKKQIGNEFSYLEKFDLAEKLLEKQNDIYEISNRTMYELLKYDHKKHQKIAKEYFDIFNQHFSDNILNKKNKEYSFVVLKIENRDELKKYLCTENIFLPVHWPGNKLENTLYEKVISIPLFSNYSKSEILKIVKNIRKFYDKNK